MYFCHDQYYQLHFEELLFQFFNCFPFLKTITKDIFLFLHHLLDKIDDLETLKSLRRPNISLSFHQSNLSRRIISNPFVSKGGGAELKPLIASLSSVTIKWAQKQRKSSEKKTIFLGEKYTLKTKSNHHHFG
jgi:hypothetical protein